MRAFEFVEKLALMPESRKGCFFFIVQQFFCHEKVEQKPKNSNSNYQTSSLSKLLTFIQAYRFV